MLLDAGDLRLRQCGDAALSRLSGEMFDHTGLETHAGVLELRTGVHSSVADAIRELGALRARLAAAIGDAHMVLESEGIAPAGPPEVRVENRFLAARDGIGAQLIDAQTGRLEPVGSVIRSMLTRCRPYAGQLGCAEELHRVSELAFANGAERQRRCFGLAGLNDVVAMLTERFSAFDAVNTKAISLSSGPTARASSSPTQGSPV